MAVVPTVVQDCVAPRASLALDRALLARARAERRPWLHVCAWPGDVLVLGRYHPTLTDGAHRRLSGGRAMPAGAGFVQVSLALPHRSALESNEPHALRAEQVLNRAVRGILGGLEVLGLDPVYPGRDLVTVRGKPIAWISLAVEEGGATLIEGSVSVERDLSLLAPLADRVDPQGGVPVTLWQPAQVTSVAQERGRDTTCGEVALAIVEGYRRRFGWTIEMHGSLAVPDTAPETAVCDDEGPRAGAWARRPAMLGVLLASARTGADGRLTDVQVRGDVIAPAATMSSLERALTGQSPEHAAVLGRIAAVLAEPADFLLGASAEDVASVVLAAAGR